MRMSSCFVIITHFHLSLNLLLMNVCDDLHYKIKILILPQVGDSFIVPANNLLIKLQPKRHDVLRMLQETWGHTSLWDIRSRNEKPYRKLGGGGGALQLITLQRTDRVMTQFTRCDSKSCGTVGYVYKNAHRKLTRVVEDAGCQIKYRIQND